MKWHKYLGDNWIKKVEFLNAVKLTNKNVMKLN